ncbi:MAG: Head fiber protein [Lachnospiraceae bacterium]|nr:Head fiber protein [Lachnospiraceae bacterium]
MSYNVKNYTEQGGAVTHIDGTLAIGASATITGLGASTSKAGLVKKAAAVADAAGEAPTAAEFKALLDSLRTAGILATS